MVTVRVRGVSKRFRITKGTAALPTLIPPGVARTLRLPERPQPVRKEIWALRDMTFKVAAGTILGIIGPNGAGKTTLLKVLARITPPTEGRIETKGRVVPLLEVGAAFQPDATGRENVYLNAALYGIPRGDVDRRMEEIVQFSGVGTQIDTPIRHYSSGMYLRLAFSMAVNLDPDILLADEVLAVGDLAFQEQCLRRVEDAGHAGLTVLFVSHDMAAVRRLCNRVIWINGGRIVADGRTDEVVHAYEESMWALIAGNEEGGSHVNEYAEILNTRLLSADEAETGAARVTDELVIRAAFRVRRSDVGFRCIHVFSANGVDAFRSVQPQPMTVDEPGVYFVDVRIPPHLLSDTVYSVKTGVWIVRDGTEDRRNALVRHQALTFRVYDTDEAQSARGSYSGPLVGVVRPRLTWSDRPATEVTESPGTAA